MINRNLPIPLYYQLKQVLIDQINRGDWHPGDMLPTEQQLQVQYEISRTTVRQAFRELELEGRVSRYRGRGTFVAKPKLAHSPEPRLSLTNFLLQQGMVPGWHLISNGWGPLPADVALRLGLEAGVEAYCLCRLRLADQEPIGYHIAYVSPKFSQAIDEESLTEGGSLHYLLSNGFLHDSHADRTLEAIPAGEEEGELLDIERGSPVFYIHRLLRSADGEAIEDFRGFYRGDRFKYRIADFPADQPMNR